MKREPGALARVIYDEGASTFGEWQTAFSGPPGPEPRAPLCDVYKEQTPLPLLPEPHPLDFTGDVSVFEFGTPDKKPVWI